MHDPLPGRNVLGAMGRGRRTAWPAVLLGVVLALVGAQPVAAKGPTGPPAVGELRAELLPNTQEIRLSALVGSDGLKTSWRIEVSGFVLCEGPFRTKQKPAREPLRVGKGSIAKNVGDTEVTSVTLIGEHVARSFVVVARNARGQTEASSPIPPPSCPAE